jgi:hypothetical protein
VRSLRFVLFGCLDGLTERIELNLGATHVGVSTGGLGLTGAEHVAAVERLHRELSA